MKILQGDIKGEGIRPAVIAGRFNQKLTDVLLDETLKELISQGVDEGDITVVHVPGSFEIPGIIPAINKTCNPDGFICLGVIIRGETVHHRVISDAVARSIVEISREINKPVIFGIVNAENYEQAKERVETSKRNRGRTMARNLVEMVNLYKKF